MLTTLFLTRRLLADGYGRVEFAFNVVFWLILVVRDCFETIVTREIARQPRLTAGLVNRVIALKWITASTFYLLVLAGVAPWLDRWGDVGLLSLYGLLLFTTAVGIDFVFRGWERVGVVAVSLCARTLTYAAGVYVFVQTPNDIAWVPAWLVGGELLGIALVWAVYSRTHGAPRPRFSRRFAGVVVRRGRSVALIQLCQAVLVTADLMVVGVLTSWAEVGRYSAPHRMVAALLAIGMIFQQVVLPSMARHWRMNEPAGRRVFEFAVRVLMLVFVPIAVGGTLLAGPLAGWLFPSSFGDSATLLAIGVWRAPLLSLAFLYQTALIAVNREAAGVRLLMLGALGSAPGIVAGYWTLGLPGASLAVALGAMLLVVAGYASMSHEGHAPAWHHHLLYPLLGSLAMAPVCLWTKAYHPVASVASGGIAYVLTVFLSGGFRNLGFAERASDAREPSEPHLVEASRSVRQA